MAFDDILGKKNKKQKIEETKDSIIESLKYNLKEKEKLIKDLSRQVTELEGRLENINQQVFGI